MVLPLAGWPAGRKKGSFGGLDFGGSIGTPGRNGGLIAGGIPLGRSFAVGPSGPGRDGCLAVAVAFTSGCRRWRIRSVQGKAESPGQSSPSGRFVSGGVAGSCAGIGWIARRGGPSGLSYRVRRPSPAQGKRRIARAESSAGLLGTDGAAGTWTGAGRVARDDGSSEPFGTGGSTGSCGIERDPGDSSALGQGMRLQGSGRSSREGYGRSTKGEFSSRKASPDLSERLSRRRTVLALREAHPPRGKRDAQARNPADTPARARG